MEEEIQLDKQVQESQFMENMLDKVINYNPPPKNNNYKTTKSLQRGYKFQKFKEIIEHKELMEAQRDFEEQIKNPSDDFFMSFYKASYDGELKECLPYLRKAYYAKNETNKKKSKK